MIEEENIEYQKERKAILIRKCISSWSILSIKQY